MFYKTTVMRMSGGNVIDVQGKVLSLVGNKLVKAGDIVYTDGNIIFGHTPIRGGGIFDVPSGIPVLGDENLLSEQEGELRGYFTRNGTFRKFSVAKNDWITNSDKEFDSGKEKFGDEKVIDAFINKGREKLVLTGGIYRDSHTLDLTGVRLSVIDYRTDSSRDNVDDDTKTILIPTYGYGGGGIYKQTLGSEKFSDEKSPATIFLDGKKKKEIDLKKYAEDIEERASKCADKIMKQAYQKNDANLSIQMYTQAIRSGREYEAKFPQYYGYGTDLYEGYEEAKPPPDEPFTAYTIAYIQTANINEDGFSGTVFASTYGYCFPYIQPRFKYRFFAQEPEWTGIATFLKEAKPQVVTDTELVYEEGPIHHYGIEDMLLDEWKCVPFGCSAIYRVTAGEDDEVKEPIVFRTFGGIDSDVMVVEENVACLTGNCGMDPESPLFRELLEKRHIELKPGDDDDDEDKVDEGNLVPVGEGFFWMDKFGRLSFYNSDKEEIAKEIPIHDDLVHIEIGHGEYYADQIWYDKYIDPDGREQTDGGSQCMLFFNDKPYLHCKVYTSDGEVKNSLMFIGGAGEQFVYKDDEGNIMEKLKGEQGEPYIVMCVGGAEPEDEEDEEDEEEPLLPMDGYYIKKADEDDDGKIKLEPLQFTPLFYQFKNGSYLYGVKDGKLYLKEKNDNEGKEVGDKIKNFRLEELRAVTKSRKSKN